MNIAELTVVLSNSSANMSSYVEDSNFDFGDRPSPPPTIVTLAEFFAPDGPRAQWVDRVNYCVPHTPAVLEQFETWGTWSVADVEKWLTENGIVPYVTTGHASFTYYTWHTYGDYHESSWGEWLSVKTGQRWDEKQTIFNHRVEYY